MSFSDVNPPPSIGLYGKSWQTILTSIIPTADDEIKLKSCFDKIKRILSDECKLGNVVKVGSYGKKTHIKMENKFPDIDIVILYPKFNPTAEEYSQKINELHEIVKKYTQHFTSIKTTLYSVQAIVDNINIDMLPAMEMDDPTRFIMKMKDDPNVQRYLSACASLAQKNFIQAQSNRYKEMVRLVKYWKSKQQWTPAGSAPISYLLELLMLDVYNQYAHLETDASVHGGLFQRFLDLVTKLSSKTRIAFNMFYHETVATSYHKKISDIVSGEIPVIIDPTNPSMNVASRLTNLQSFREHAQSTLIELQMTMSRSIDIWTNTQQRLLLWNQRLVTFQNFLLKMETNLVFSIKNIKLSTLKDMESQSAQMEHVHQDWLNFKDHIIGASKNIRIDFKVHISKERGRTYEPFSKQWTTSPITGQKVYLTTKEEKLKYGYSEQTFEINEYYSQDNIDVQCEINLLLFP